MNTRHNEFSKRFFNSSFDDLKKAESEVIQRLVERKSIARDMNAEFDTGVTFGARVSDKVASFGGSWTFIGLFSGFILGWILINSLVLARADKAFDPYPFIALNLVLSMVAALQAPVIMMSQNRQAARDRLDASHDYEINLKAELEILHLHEKIDELRTSQWQELVEIQQEQIKMLMTLVKAQADAAASAAPGKPQDA